jgi:pyruvate/2-oxoglutarate dehydrogenase complex dihydrolipoamide dehydrogenase (E3) component
VNEIEDCANLLTGGKKIVVIGSSFIGMEVSNCLAGMKHEVSIIGMEEEPMVRQFQTMSANL